MKFKTTTVTNKNNPLTDAMKNCSFLTADLRRYLRNVDEDKEGEKIISIEVSAEDLKTWRTAMWFISKDIDDLEDIIMRLITKDMKEVRE